MYYVGVLLYCVLLCTVVTGQSGVFCSFFAMVNVSVSVALELRYRGADDADACVPLSWVVAFCTVDVNGMIEGDG